MNASLEIVKDEEKINIDKTKVNNKVYLFIKRSIDIIGAVIGCVILVPLTLCIWIANILHGDNGPVFYIHKRIGKDGKIFKMYKFRSMIINADKKLGGYLIKNPEAREEFRKFRKLKNDFRTTKVGKFIRRTSLDEFPQFINILKGEMTLVGPRPYMVIEKKRMKEAYKDIIKVKPGLTGPWQVGGRNKITFEDRIEIEKNYVYTANLKIDIKILLKTLITCI